MTGLCTICGEVLHPDQQHVCPDAHGLGIGDVLETPLHMKLWVINRDDAVREGWRGFVVRAETEQEARDIAAAHSYYGRDSFRSSRLSTCVEVKVEGDPGIILGDFGE